MDFLRDYQSQFNTAFKTCRSRISTYPAEFREQARGCLEKINVFRDDYHGSCFSQMLPFWLEPVFSGAPEIYGQIAVGNIFGFLYFLIQDAVMDTTPGEYKADWLPLGNLFMFDFYNQYRQLFPDNSIFWSYFRRYLDEWSGSVIRERKGYWLNHAGSGGADFMELARKAAPLKITVAACCLLGNDQIAVEPLSRSLDITVGVFQLLDDWVDWHEDLAVGNCSYFLSRVMRICKIKQFAALNESHIQQAIYGHDLFERIYSIAEAKRNELFGDNVPQVPGLTKYYDSLLNIYRKIRCDIQQEKNTMMKGGFAYWLYSQGKAS